MKKTDTTKDLEENVKKATTKRKTTAKKSLAKTVEDIAKKLVEKAEPKESKTKKTTTKKAASKKTTEKKTTTKAKATTKKASTTKAKKTTTRKTTTKKVASKKAELENSEVVSDAKTSKKSVVEKFENIPEYYDLPYAYNKTVVKVLYQNPTTLFVYWEISQDDVKHFQSEFGENFFYITKPVLVVHNKTKDYSFEVDINDFANNWYIHVSDAKCEYSVKLARRPNQSDVIYDYDHNQNTNFVEVSNSNVIEMPNDHVLFYTNGQKLYFKNIKTNAVTETIYKSNGKDSRNVKAIYGNYNLDEEENRFDFRNPSSQNPTSNVMK